MLRLGRDSSLEEGSASLRTFSHQLPSHRRLSGGRWMLRRVGIAGTFALDSILPSSNRMLRFGGG